MFDLAVAVYSLLVGIVLLVVGVLLSRFATYRASLSDLRKIPGPKPSIFFGNALQLPRTSYGKRIRYISLFVLKSACASRNLAAANTS